MSDSVLRSNTDFCTDCSPAKVQGLDTSTGVIECQTPHYKILISPIALSGPFNETFINGLQNTFEDIFRLRSVRTSWYHQRSTLLSRYPL